MKYQIDQSGKVEDTNRLTIVAFANGKIKSLKISAVEKQTLVRTMRALDYPEKIFIYKIFAALIFLLIKNEKIEEVVIDKEYPGHKATIKNLLLNLFRRVSKDAPIIDFDNIGKKSAAHKTAWEVFQGKREADMVVKANDIINLLYKNA